MRAPQIGPLLAKDAELTRQNPYALTLAISYLGIRRAIGHLGLALPVLLGPAGYLLFGIPLQENMSSYYHTPMRDVFVGVMCAMGVFFYCYRGYGWFEKITSFLACVSAFGIGLCPLDYGADPLYQTSWFGYLHTASGGIFFCTLAVFSLVHFPRGHFGLRLKTRDQQRDGIYLASGLAILGSILLMGIHLFLLPQAIKDDLNSYCFLYWMEWAAVWAFSAAWLTKGHALLADSAIEGFRLLLGQDAFSQQTEEERLQSERPDNTNN